MKVKNVLTTVIGIAALAGTIGWFAATNESAPQRAGAAAPGSLRADRTANDFGTISMRNGRVTASFTVINTGGSSVTIKKVYSSCMCTTATLAIGGERRGPFGMPGHGIVPRIDAVLAPGAEAAIEVTFDPAAHGPAGVGRIQRSVYLENDAGGPLALDIEAVVTP